MSRNPHFFLMTIANGAGYMTFSLTRHSSNLSMMLPVIRDATKTKQNE
jgi:hypothetical protein